MKEVIDHVQHQNGVGLSPTQLQVVFPYHIAIDPMFHVIQTGSGLANLFENVSQIVESHISDCFDIATPFGCNWDWESMISNKQATFEFCLKEHLLSTLKRYELKKLSLKGSILLQPSNDGAIFLLHLNISDANELKNSGFQMFDISPYSLQKDLLLVADRFHTQFTVAKQVEIKQQTLKLQAVETETAKVKSILDSKKAFIRYISHELRNPLNISLLGLNLLEEQLVDTHTTLTSSKSSKSNKQSRSNSSKSNHGNNNSSKSSNVSDKGTRPATTTGANHDDSDKSPSIVDEAISHHRIHSMSINTNTTTKAITNANTRANAIKSPTRISSESSNNSSSNDTNNNHSFINFLNEEDDSNNNNNNFASTPKDTSPTSNTSTPAAAATTTTNSPEKILLLELISDIKNSNMMAVEILNDLLLYEKIDNNEFHMNIVEMKPFKLITNVVKLFTPDAKRSNIQLIRKDADNIENVYIQADIVQISQVLRNLLSNALKFTPSGGQVTVSTEIIESSTQQLSLSSSKLTLGKKSNSNSNNNIKSYVSSNSNDDEKENMNADNVNVSSKSAKRRIIANNNNTNNITNAVNISSSADYDSTASSSKNNINSTSTTSSSSSKKATKLRDDLLYAQSYMYDNNNNNNTTTATAGNSGNSGGIAMTNSLTDIRNATNNVSNATFTDDNKNIQQPPSSSSAAAALAPPASQVQQKVSPLSQHSTSPQKQQQQLSQSQRSPSPQQLSRLRRLPQPKQQQYLPSLSDSPDSHSSAVSRSSRDNNNTIQQNTITTTTNNNPTTGSNKLFNKHTNNISSSSAAGITKFPLLPQNTNYSIAEVHVEKDSDESNSNSKSNSNSNSNKNNNSNTTSNKKSNNNSVASNNSNASSNKFNTVDEDDGNNNSINSDNIDANNNIIDTSTATSIIAPTITITTSTTMTTTTSSTSTTTTFGGWWKISSLLSSIIPSSSSSQSLSTAVSHSVSSAILNSADNNNNNNNNITNNNTTINNDNISPLRSIPNSIKATSLYSSRYNNTNSISSHTNKSMTASASSVSFLSGTTTAVSADTNTINSNNNNSTSRVDSVNSTAKNSDKSSVVVKHTSDEINNTNNANINTNNNHSSTDDRPTATTAAVTNDLPYWYSSSDGDDLPLVTITPPHSSKTLLMTSSDHQPLNSDIATTATVTDLVLPFLQEQQPQNNIRNGDEESVVNRSQSLLLPIVDSSSSSHALIVHSQSQSHSPPLPLPQSYSLLPPQSLIQQQQSLLPSLSPVTATTVAESRKAALLLSPSNLHIGNRSPSPTIATSTSHSIHHNNSNKNNNSSNTQTGSSNNSSDHSNNNNLPTTFPHSNSPTRQTRISGHYTVNSHYNYSNNSTKNNNSSNNFNSASSNNYYSSDKSLLSNAISLKPISVAAAAENSRKSNMTQDNNNTDFRNSDHSNSSDYGITNNTANYNNNANNSNSNFSDKSYSLSSQKNNHNVFEISSSTSSKNNNNATQLHNNNSSANTDSNQYIDLSLNDEENNIRKNETSFIKSSSFYISNANSNTNSKSNSSKIKDGYSPDSTTTSASFVLRISVSDTGRGLSKATQKALFEEYSHCRTSSSSSSASVGSPKISSSFPSRDRGSGLGLWVSRNIVEAHKGNIGVHSEGENIGKGSTFYIDIPIFKIAEKNEYDNTSGKSMIHNTSSKSLKSQNTSSKSLQSQKYDQNVNESSLNLDQSNRISPLSLVLQNLDINNDELQSSLENANNQTKTARSNNNSRSTSASRNVNNNDNNGSSKNSYQTNSSSSNSVISTSHRQQQQYHNNRQLQISSVTPRCLQSILIVDDDKLCRKMIHHSITRLSTNSNNKNTSSNSKSMNNTSSNQNTFRMEFPMKGSFSSAATDNINNAIDNLKDTDSKTAIAISINEAVDGADAIEKYKNSISGAEGTFPYDVIMMDFVMPVMDGPTATQQLRTLGYKGLIVGVTGNSLPSDVELFLESGANKVMIKPLDINKFMTYATTWIQRLA